ncbi:Lrp/AsnC family transcriptional regulator [Candidatus Woesearchaeota archaeon]|nr:Lrp/AsnC family transcriptional regulator [Candidatus Woesearchaeota archaeon]
MKLDETDRKLLAYLYHNYREPLTKIAKECRISRDQVDYRLKKYEKDGVIQKYFTIFNYNSLGYNYFINLFIKTKTRNENLINKLKEIKNVISFGDIVSNYDFFITMVVYDLVEFQEIYYNLLNEFKEDIEESDYFIITNGLLFPIKMFGKYKDENYNLIGKNEKAKIDNEEIKILKALEKNSRIRIVDLAKEVKMSPELILYKLKQLKNKGIILGSRIQFNMKLLGFYFAVIRFNLKILNKKEMHKISEYSKQHKYVNSVSFGISDYNCMIQIFYQNEEELRNSVLDIKNGLKGNINKLEVIHVGEDEFIKTLPI